MTTIIPWLAALVVLILFIVSISWLCCWYFWRWVIEADREQPLHKGGHFAYGDSTHLPADYWETVAREEAKRHAA